MSALLQTSSNMSKPNQSLVTHTLNPLWVYACVKNEHLETSTSPGDIWQLWTFGKRWLFPKDMTSQRPFKSHAFFRVFEGFLLQTRLNIQQKSEVIDLEVATL